MVSRTAYFWKKTPFIRILLPFTAGIIIQWYVQVPSLLTALVLAFSFAIIIVFFFISFFSRYKMSWLGGLGLNILFMAAGALLTSEHDIRNNDKWFGRFYEEKGSIVITLDEPLIEKTKSFKANASVNCIIKNKEIIKVTGKIILYFKKDSLLPGIDYGSQIILNKALQEIKNSGNPGGFDYKRYSLFQGITHQVYLKPGEFQLLEEKNTTLYQQLFYPVREKVLNIIRANIKGDKETGLAEALLIGYKNDLDKTLVQSYTNTGVVHIIAISGLHIGLIYWLLLQLLRPLQKRKYSKWLQPILIIAGLWAFSLLAGGQASVLRSALMFTGIVLGQAVGKNYSVYNTMALSALILLCYNPYWLWDVGFQLSYSAVLSIMIFMKPIYNWFYVKNKILDFIWKLNAVTLAAQILTLPLSIYHFHQFPSYFLLTNFVAVPLSSIIVLGEIFLCAVSFIPSVAFIAGKILSWLIGIMNSYVERIEILPGSRWDGMQINIIQTILLIVFIAGLSFWLLEKINRGLIVGLLAALGFSAIRFYSFVDAVVQKKIIVYNVPQRQAIDFVDGRDYWFYGDPDLLADDFVRNFHLKPSRILNRATTATSTAGFVFENKYACYHHRKILLADTLISFADTEEKQDIDFLIISKNPKLYISKLANTFNIKQVVFDASVSSRKLKYWKKDCDSLHIPWHDVSENGAFVMNLN